MNLFIIESPFQLLCAIEAKKELKLTNNILVINLLKEDKSNKQIENLVALTPWDKIYRVPYFFSYKWKVFEFIFVIYCFLKKLRFNNVFIGDIRTDMFWLVANNIKVDNIWMLDDGAGTVSVQQRIFSNLKTFNATRNKKKDFVAKFFFLNSLDRTLINIFSMYKLKPLGNETIRENTFGFVRERMKGLVLDEDHVYFIGTNLVQPLLLSEHDYILAFGKVYDYYKHKNKKIKYILHRRENRALIEMNFPDMEIVSFDNIVEIEFLLKQIRPQHIASFYSAALYTLKKVYNVKTVDSFLIDLRKIDSTHKEAIKACYRFNQDYMNIIDLGEI